LEVREREDLLREGEAAIAAADWETARASLERVLEQGESPEALIGLSKIAMIEREYDRAIELKERAFELQKSAGQMEAASLNATWLTFMYVTYQSNFSVGLGWKERASSVRGQQPQRTCVARGNHHARPTPLSRLATC
jgi:tetratricopeptide (TPR) repeat protein